MYTHRDKETVWLYDFFHTCMHYMKCIKLFACITFVSLGVYHVIVYLIELNWQYDIFALYKPCLTSFAEAVVTFVDGSSTSSNTSANGGSGNGNNTVDQDELDKLRNDLKINPRTTVKYKRSLGSEYEDRISHIIMGSTGIFVILAVFGYICSLDFIRHIRVHGKIKIIHGMDQYQVHGDHSKGKRKGQPRDLDFMNHIYT